MYTPSFFLPTLRFFLYRLFSQNIDMFGFEDCSFAVQKAKESTARIVMWREFNLINSYTLEASFLGPNKGENFRRKLWGPNGGQKCG